MLAISSFNPDGTAQMNVQFLATCSLLMTFAELADLLLNTPWMSFHKSILQHNCNKRLFRPFLKMFLRLYRWETKPKTRRTLGLEGMVGDDRLELPTSTV